MALFSSQDYTEEALQGAELATKRSTGFSLFHALTFGSIGLSLYLYWVADRKMDGLFVGLWAPTFEALRSSFQDR